MKPKMKKCEDGQKRPFVRRKVQFVEVWNAISRQYADAGKAWNEATSKGDAPSIQFHEGALSAFTACLHIMRHFKDGDVFELPANPPEYIDLDEIEQEMANDMKARMEAKDE